MFGKVLLVPRLVITLFMPLLSYGCLGEAGALFLGWVGGLVAWLLNKLKQARQALYMPFSGINMGILPAGLLVLYLARNWLQQT